MILRICIFIVVLVVTMAFSGAPDARGGEWEERLQGAKKEGAVSVIATVGADFRNALTLSFEKKYNLRVNYMGMRGSQLTPRVMRERRAGKFLWDVFVHGTTTALAVMKPAGVLDPIESTLILPEVKDPKNWVGGRHTFSDADHYNLLAGLTTRPAFAINSKLAKIQDFSSFRDLLAPRWKGKIIVGRDPRHGGPGQSIFTFFYLNPQLGPEFIRALVKQDLTILRNDRQSLDMLGRGRFTILLGPAETVTSDLMKRGVPIQLVPPQGLKEGGPLSPGPVSLMLVNQAPHPNAARVYLNWFLSKEGQTQFSRITGIPSLRVDVPTDHLDSWRLPMKKGIPTYTEEAIEKKDALLKLLKEVLG